MQTAADAAPAMSLTPLANGFCLGRAPRWFEGLLWFSDSLGAAVHTVTLGGSMTTLSLPGRAPHGLGFRPDGTLLIASATDRHILRYDGDTVDTVATLADRNATVPADLGDMVVDGLGRAYVGCPAREGVIVRIDPDDTVTVVADGLDCPSGMAISADRTTLLVAESASRRLTSFTIGSDGTLADRQTFAEGMDGPPDGIALDADGGVWTSMPLAHQFQRIVAGGAVTDRIHMSDRIPVACTLGGPGHRILFLLSSTDVYHHRVIGSTTSCLDAVAVDIPGAGPS